MKRLRQNVEITGMVVTRHVRAAQREASAQTLTVLACGTTLDSRYGVCDHGLVASRWRATAHDRDAPTTLPAQNRLNWNLICMWVPRLGTCRTLPE
eukprot:2689192-Prymnesium_polylepis.1